MSDEPHEPNEAFRVDLPAGGNTVLETADEVDLWNEHAKRYQEDYGLHRLNDLMHLGTLLTYAIHAHRAQQMLSDPKKGEQAQSRMTKASDGIERVEKLLGIDKKSREAGGKHTVDAYIETLKRAAHEKGVHIATRVREHERVLMELSWKIRLLRNGDDEDRRQHNVSEREIIDWLEQELLALEEKDKTWAAEKGVVFVGKL
jgi:hypothetical protein